MIQTVQISEKIRIMNIWEEGIAPHNHDYYELVYVLEGSAEQTLSGTSVTVQKGDYFVVDYNSYHGYSNCKDFHIINCLFKPEFIDKALKGCIRFGELITSYLIHFNYGILSKIPADNVFHDDSGEMRELFEKLDYEYRYHTGGYIELMRCYLIQILVLSMRSIYVPDIREPHPATKKITEYVDEHFAEHISLGKLCEELNFSLPYISKRFKQDTGFTFQQYLQNVRIEHSCRLLAETDKKITHIAHNVGYDDIKFFGKIFKQKMNMSPREFRRMTRQS
ncbi:MAG: helix-turn-helix domain-containing protein [Clostridia bacterium]|nr:helix-turn-helix domain-containing protein [Clostridia bacterium]